MKLKQLYIKGLYKEYSFRWDLDSSVNILAGDNGSYKTTLLKILKSLCIPESLNKHYHLDEALLTFEHNITLKYKNFEDSLLKLKKESTKDEMLQELAAKISADLKDLDEKSLSGRIMRADIIAVKEGKEKMLINSFKERIKIDYISTFDVPSKQSEKSALDSKLEELERDYAYYLSDLSKVISEQIISKGKIDVSDFEDIYAKNNCFIGIINKAFSNTNKELDTRQSKLQFNIGKKVLDSNTLLSSGEKQFLIVMLTILLEKQQEYILIMDEPEISMHFEWQKTLIEDIQRLNPNCQIILTTHSPALIMNGWEQRVTNIRSIKL